jgi:hypothetical protein
MIPTRIESRLSQRDCSYTTEVCESDDPKHTLICSKFHRKFSIVGRHVLMRHLTNSSYASKSPFRSDLRQRFLQEIHMFKTLVHQGIIDISWLFKINQSSAEKAITSSTPVPPMTPEGAQASLMPEMVSTLLSSLTIKELSFDSDFVGADTLDAQFAAYYESFNLLHDMTTRPSTSSLTPANNCPYSHANPCQPFSTSSFSHTPTSSNLPLINSLATSQPSLTTLPKSPLPILLSHEHAFPPLPQCATSYTAALKEYDKRNYAIVENVIKNKDRRLAAEEESEESEDDDKQQKGNGKGRRLIVPQSV